MDWPVFGFQTGETLPPLEKVRRFGRPPLTSETYSSAAPVIEEEKMICVPSGDQVGVAFVPRKRAKETGFPVSKEYMQICALTTPLKGAKQVKAMRDASGDQRGVSEMEPRCVSWCWLAP